MMRTASLGERNMNLPSEEHREAMNRQAYEDVLDCLPPRYLSDEWYMMCFRNWRPLQKYPGEEFENDYL